MDGDKIELTIEKVGTLKFNVKDELKRTWARTTRSQHKDKGGEGAHTPQTGGKYAKASASTEPVSSRRSCPSPRGTRRAGRRANVIQGHHDGA